MSYTDDYLDENEEFISLCCNSTVDIIDESKGTIQCKECEKHLPIVNCVIENKHNKKVLLELKRRK